MHSDYYDPSPPRPLDRPVVLAGFVGARVDTVARLLAATTGHPLVDLERGIEHHAGCTIAEIVLRDGVPELRRLEARWLPLALTRRPPPIVALGEGTLLDPAMRGLVARTSTLVYLRAPLDHLVAVLRAQIAANPGRHYASLFGLQPSEALLAPILQERRPGYEAADVVIDANDAPVRVAAAIQAALQI